MLLKVAQDVSYCAAYIVYVILNHFDVEIGLFNRPHFVLLHNVVVT